MKRNGNIQKFAISAGLAGLVGIGFVLTLLIVRTGTITLRPAGTHGIPVTATNVLFSMRTTGRLLIIDRQNYEVEAQLGTVKTNYYGDAGPTTTDISTPAYPYTFKVPIPANAIEFKVSVYCYQGSALRGQLCDLVSDSNGILQNNWLIERLGDLIFFLEPRFKDVDVVSSNYVKTESGWVPGPGTARTNRSQRE